MSNLAPWNPMAWKLKFFLSNLGNLPPHFEQTTSSLANGCRTSRHERRWGYETPRKLRNVNWRNEGLFVWKMIFFQFKGDSNWVVSNIFHFHPEPWGNDPHFDYIIFFKGVEPRGWFLRFQLFVCFVLGKVSKFLKRQAIKQLSISLSLLKVLGW